MNSVYQAAKDAFDRVRGAYLASPNDKTFAALNEATREHKEAGLALVRDAEEQGVAANHVRLVGQREARDEAQKRIDSIAERRPELAGENHLEALARVGVELGRLAVAYAEADALNCSIDGQEIVDRQLVEPNPGDPHGHTRSIEAARSRRREHAVAALGRAIRAGIERELPNGSEAALKLARQIVAWHPTNAEPQWSFSPTDEDHARARRAKVK